jgi:hypothetical protein
MHAYQGSCLTYILLAKFFHFFPTLRLNPPSTLYAQPFSSPVYMDRRNISVLASDRFCGYELKFVQFLM